MTVHDSFLSGAVRFFEGSASAHRASMKRKISLSDVPIRTVIKESRIVSLSADARPAAEDGKMQDFVARDASRSGFELRFYVKKAYEQLQVAIRSV